MLASAVINLRAGDNPLGSQKRRLLEIFRETSFKSSKEPVFRLASGKLSRYYVDCKRALSNPEARKLIGHLIFEAVKGEQFDAVGGLELGAYPIATSVSDAVYDHTGRLVRAFVVRKEPKTHGITDLIAGHVEPGDRALIVDDVITSGSSTIKAVEAARSAGLIVERAVVLVDRQEGNGRASIESKQVQFSSLLTLSDFLVESNDDAVQDGPAEHDHRRAVRGQSGRAVLVG
jgi:orotate phosphoribosyltransferase